MYCQNCEAVCSQCFIEILPIWGATCQIDCHHYCLYNIYCTVAWLPHNNNIIGYTWADNEITFLFLLPHSLMLKRRNEWSSLRNRLNWTVWSSSGRQSNRSRAAGGFGRLSTSPSHQVCWKIYRFSLSLSLSPSLSLPLPLSLSFSLAYLTTIKLWIVCIRMVHLSW